MTATAQLVATAGYLPEHVVSAPEIAQQSGIPESVIVDRFGLTGRHLAADDEHVCDMAVTAGQRVLAEAGLEPADLDAVVYFGSTWKEYPVWQAAPRIAHLLGCDGAFALELDYVSCGTPVALRVVRDMLVAEPDLRKVLLVGASRESRLVDPTDRGTRFALNFGDGAVAAVMTRGQGDDHTGIGTVLGSHATTNGSYSLQVKMPIGGSRKPMPDPQVATGYVPRLRVADLDDMKHGLDAESLPAFRTAAEIAVKRSGATLADIDVVCPIHMKRSMHRALLAELGVPEANAVYLDDTGHMSGVDPLLGLDRARRSGRLRPGALCLLIAGGTGYTWAATCVRIGEDG